MPVPLIPPLSHGEVAQVSFIFYTGWKAEVESREKDEVTRGEMGVRETGQCKKELTPVLSTRLEGKAREIKEEVMKQRGSKR
jgi:hypothetical protein